MYILLDSHRGYEQYTVLCMASLARMASVLLEYRVCSDITGNKKITVPAAISILYHVHELPLFDFM